MWNPSGVRLSSASPCPRARRQLRRSRASVRRTMGSLRESTMHLEEVNLCLLLLLRN